MTRVNHASLPRDEPIGGRPPLGHRVWFCLSSALLEIPNCGPNYVRYRTIELGGVFFLLAVDLNLISPFTIGCGCFVN